MVRDLNFDLEIIIAPIVREPDGLAMSSRNIYLTPEQRTQSIVLSQSLRLAEKLLDSGEHNCNTIINEMKKLISAQPLASPDYVSITEMTTLNELTEIQKGITALISLAVRFGTTRLIDNTIVTVH